MKIKISLLVLIIAFFLPFAYAQTYQVVEKQYNLEEPFSGIIIEGILTVNYMYGDPSGVTIISTPEDASRVKLETLSLGGGEKLLKISSSGVNNSKTLIANIQGNVLKHIELSGITSFTAKMPLNEERLFLKMSGTSVADIDGIFGELTVNAGGTANADITGEARQLTITASGVSQINVSRLQYETGAIDASGVSTVYVNKEGNNNISSSGMSSVKMSDRSTVSYGNKQIITHADKNTTITLYNVDTLTSDSVYDYILDVTESGINYLASKTDKDSWWNAPMFKWKRKKFDGHWGGIDIGINGYNTANFDMNYPEEYNYMELHFPKSVSFYLNLIECNFSFSKNQKWGMLSGLGFEWRNYRFSHKNTWLSDDGNSLSAYYIRGAEVKKSKLTICYLTVPVIFEFQTNNRKSFKNSFHIGIGVVGGIRIGTHSKIKFQERHNTYTLEPVNNYEMEEIPMTSNNRIVKNYDDFYLAPLKLDATVRIGWGRINLFATYSVFNMFRANRGPELYPWAAGITLLSW